MSVSRIIQTPSDGGSLEFEDYATVTTRGQSLFNALRQSRRGTRMAVVAGILAVVVALVVPGLPRTVRVSFRLPEGVRSLDVDYEAHGELVRSARFSWSGDSPEVVRHEPDLSPGRYVIVATVAAQDARIRHLRRSVQVDPGRVAHVDLRGAE